MTLSEKIEKTENITKATGGTAKMEIEYDLGRETQLAYKLKEDISVDDLFKALTEFRNNIRNASIKNTAKKTVLFIDEAQV